LSARPEFVDTGIIERHYGRALRIAEELRSEADYSISREISKEEAREIIKDAKEFLARIEELEGRVGLAGGYAVRNYI
jgi:uncharacterized protein (UPF0332 family)